MQALALQQQRSPARAAALRRAAAAASCYILTCLSQPWTAQLQQPAHHLRCSRATSSSGGHCVHKVCARKRMCGPRMTDARPTVPGFLAMPAELSRHLQGLNRQHLSLVLRGAKLFSASLQLHNQGMQQIPSLQPPGLSQTVLSIAPATAEEVR